MRSGRLIDVKFNTTVFEAVFGQAVVVEYRLGPESETSFFDDTLSIDLVLQQEGKVPQFLLLHPWFVKHVVFVWKVRETTHNILVTDFKYVTHEPNDVIVCRVKIKPIDNLTACQAIEDARRTIESYDGTNASKLKDDYESKDYFKSGLLPRLDI